MNVLPDFFTETRTLLVLVIVLIAIYGYAPYGMFKRIGVRGPTPWPFIGTYFNHKLGILHFYEECHKKYGKVWGMYEGRIPMLHVIDTRMIKTILVKEGYSAFINRLVIDPSGVLSKSFYYLKDETWKRVHRIVSAAFTSGRRKEMFPIMLRHSSNLLRNIRKLGNESIDIKNTLECFTTDICLGIFFSVDVETLNNPSSPFIHYLQEVAFPFIVPLLNKMNITITSNKTMQFFLSFIKTVKAQRANKPMDRVDFMQVMLKSQIPKGSKENSNTTGPTDEEITTQALAFALVGNTNLAHSVAFAAYTLAVHPDTQTKLQAEIDRTFPGKCRPTYEKLVQVKYLDMVTMETWRLYPIGPRLDRETKYNVEVNGLIIPKGVLISIPIHTLHRDPDVWPDPDSFKPERFSKENKNNVDPYGFLTFGMGPRACTAMRMSMLIVKWALVEILQHFSFVPCQETDIPMVLSKDGMVIPKKPIMLKVEPREPAT